MLPISYCNTISFKNADETWNDIINKAREKWESCKTANSSFDLYFVNWLKENYYPPTKPKFKIDEYYTDDY